jgi:hypothetical protein
MAHGDTGDENRLDSRDFPLCDVITVGTARMVSRGGMEAVQALLSHMAAEPVYTHQMPRVLREAAAALRAMHPDLVPLLDEAGRALASDLPGKLVAWEQRYGELVAVRVMTEDEHERIDQASEAAERFSPDRVVRF